MARSVKALVGLSFRLCVQPSVKPLLRPSSRLSVQPSIKPLIQPSYGQACQEISKTSGMLHDHGTLVLTGTGERRLVRPATPPLLPLLMCPRVMAMCLPGQPSVKPLLGLSFKLHVSSRASSRFSGRAPGLVFSCASSRSLGRAASWIAIKLHAKAFDLLRDSGTLVLTGTGERRLAKPASPPLLPLLICPSVMAISCCLASRASSRFCG